MRSGDVKGKEAAVTGEHPEVIGWKVSVDENVVLVIPRTWRNVRTDERGELQPRDYGGRRPELAGSEGG